MISCNHLFKNTPHPLWNKIYDLFIAGKSLAEYLESLLEKKQKNAKIFFQSLFNESLEAQNEAEK